MIVRLPAVLALLFGGVARSTALADDVKHSVPT